ncbi:MAG: hypothetical protein V1735_01015 [Nanoarchaeota archaeon]
MTNPTVLSEQPIMLAELKEELARSRKRDTELSFRAQKTEDYLNAITVVKQSKAKELYNAILKLNIPRLKEAHIMKIVDLMPKTVESLKVVLQGYTLTINNENMKKIVSVIAEEK